MMLGDSASFLNSQRLKGIHLAIKSGMLAAETAFDALLSGNTSVSQLERIQAARRRRAGSAKSSIRCAISIRRFEHGLIDGLGKGWQFSRLLRGSNLGPDFKNEAGYLNMKLADELSPWGDRRAHFLGNAKGDGKLTFDRLTDVYHSGTRHEDDQPTHLVIADLDICNSRCGKEFGNPCQYFCPAAVYEMVETSPPETRRNLSRTKQLAH